MVSGRSGGFTQALKMRSAWAWAARISAGVGSCHTFSAASSGLRAATMASTCVSSSGRPRLRVATVVTIGAPISWDSRSRSMRRPWRWAMSYMLRASTNGRPTCFSSSTSRKTRRRLVASATQIRTSGAASPVSLPSTASRVTTSSGLRARKE